MLPGLLLFFLLVLPPLLVSCGGSDDDDDGGLGMDGAREQASPQCRDFYFQITQ